MKNTLPAKLPTDEEIEDAKGVITRLTNLKVL